MSKANRHMTIHVDDETRAELKARASESGVSVSELIRIMLDMWGKHSGRKGIVKNYKMRQSVP